MALSSKFAPSRSYHNLSEVIYIYRHGMIQIRLVCENVCCVVMTTIYMIVADTVHA